MFGLSTLWLRVIGVAVIAALVGGVLWGAYTKGYTARDTEAKLELSQALLRAAKSKDELQVAFAALSSRSQKEAQSAKIKIQDLESDARAGALRLYFSAVRQPGAGDSTPGPVTERAQLDGPTAAALIGITGDGDQAIRDLNECIAKYNEVKEKLDGYRTH